MHAEYISHDICRLEQALKVSEQLTCKQEQIWPHSTTDHCSGTAAF